MKDSHRHSRRAAADRVLRAAGGVGDGARLIALESLPTAWETLRELPAILTDPRSLYDILSSIRRMVIGFALALRCSRFRSA